MPEGLTQTKTPNSPKTGRRLIGTPAGFKSEWWPTSDRNGGRLQIGIPGRNESESATIPAARRRLAEIAAACDPGDGGRMRHIADIVAWLDAKTASLTAMRG